MPIASKAKTAFGAKTKYRVGDAHSKIVGYLTQNGFDWNNPMQAYQDLADYLNFTHTRSNRNQYDWTAAGVRSFMACHKINREE